MFAHTIQKPSLHSHISDTSKLLNLPFRIFPDVENAKEAIEDPEMQASEMEFLEAEYRARIEAIEKLPVNLARMKLTYLKGTKVQASMRYL